MRTLTPATAAADKNDKPLRLTKRIGSTTYKVSVHFSRTSKETMGDKILRLIENEAAQAQKPPISAPYRNSESTVPQKYPTAGKREL